MEPATERWQEEQQSAWLYQELIKIESDPHRKELFGGLRAATLHQAELIAEEIKTLNQPIPTFSPSPRARFVIGLARLTSTDTIRTMLPAMKVRGISAWTPDGHQGGRHQSAAGGNLRAAVFGINDGLVSNASLIFGISGANAEPETILLAGIAGLLAGAFSMAAGEFVSMASQRELLEGQLAEERDELLRYPEDEAEELVLIYKARGIPEDVARILVNSLIANPDRALDTLAREELGVNPDDLGSPWGAAISSFLAFAVGAGLPLLPFLLTLPHAVAIAVAITATALLLVGASLSLYSGKSAFWGGLRMLGIGGMAGLATWLVGSWVGSPGL